MDKTEYEIVIKGKRTKDKLIKINETLIVSKNEAEVYFGNQSQQEAISYINFIYPGINIKGDLSISIKELSEKPKSKKSKLKIILALIFIPIVLIFKLLKVIVKA